ncbi:MAG: 4-oxalomesaconate tautomerase [Alsobacter sp.]
MSEQIRIPCVMMRGGTSRGPFFLAADLPSAPVERDRLLLSIMGSGTDLPVDGIAGGNPVTNKVAIVGTASIPGADVDYLFAQVRVREGIVDTTPNCGNLLSGVGPFAIEEGLVRATAGETRIRVHNVNTGKIMLLRVRTPDRRVTYEGDVAIDGVPGTAAPVHLSFPDAAGAKTGRLLPTGRLVDTINGVEVSCVDAAIPVMLVRASAFGWTGLESPEQFAADPAFALRLEAIRVAAGRRMGFDDASDLVIPKPVLLAAPNLGGTLTVRYFMPHQCHRAMAITGAVATAIACTIPGTVAADVAGSVRAPHDVVLQHPSGSLTVQLEPNPSGAAPVASVVRTARRLFEGAVFARAPLSVSSNAVN